MNLRILRRAEAFAQALFSCSFMCALNVNLLSRTTPRILSVSFVWTLESLTWNSHWYDDGPMAIACVLAALICKKFILNHLDSTLRSELITNCKIRVNKAARTERFPVSAAKFSSGKQREVFARILRKVQLKYTVSMPEKNLDLLKQGPRGIGG